MYEYAEPQSLAEMQARHVDIRRRLFPTRKRQAPVQKPAKNLLRFICHHDAHVTAYRMHQRARETEELLEDVHLRLRKHQRSREIAEDILANEPEFTWKDIIAPGRKAHVVVLRQAIMHAIKQEHSGLSTTQIGRLIGGRDHTTALHAINRVNRAIEEGDGVWRKTATGREYFVRHVRTAHYGYGRRK